MIQPDFKTFCRLARHGNLVPVYDTLHCRSAHSGGRLPAHRARRALRLPAGKRRGRRKDRPLHVRGRQSRGSVSHSRNILFSNPARAAFPRTDPIRSILRRIAGALPPGAVAGSAAAGSRRDRLFRLRHGAPVRAHSRHRTRRSGNGRRRDDVLSRPGGLRSRAPPRLDRAQRFYRGRRQPARQISTPRRATIMRRARSQARAARWNAHLPEARPRAQDDRSLADHVEHDPRGSSSRRCANPRNTSAPETFSRWSSASALPPKPHADPFEIYRALRVINPSPYMYFLKLDDVAIVGSSPEMLVKVQGREAFYSADRRHASARPRRSAKTAATRPSCWPIPRSAPSTSCWWTWAATIWAASPSTARCAWSD